MKHGEAYHVTLRHKFSMALSSAMFLGTHAIPYHVTFKLVSMFCLIA